MLAGLGQRRRDCGRIRMAPGGGNRARKRLLAARPVDAATLELLAEVGDTLKVNFRNNADRPFSMHPHGLRYDEDNDGADHRGAGASIAPGATFTYTWQVDEEAGPGPTDPSSIVWLYHSHVGHVDDIYQGLVFPADA